MDEPFNALDVQTRAEMESEFLSLREARRFTTIFVTHDVRQAAFLGDRVLVMSDRPARIKAAVPVPFSRPRPISIRRTAEFHALEDELSARIAAGG
jgi:NitT/TauT family transport system ATP-binding protein